MKRLRLAWQEENKQSSERAGKVLRYLRQPTQSQITRHQILTHNLLMALLTVSFFASIKCQLIEQCSFLKDSISLMKACNKIKEKKRK